MLRKYAPLVGLQENFTIYDSGDSAQTLRRVIAEAKIDSPLLTPEAVGRAISWAKNNLISAEKYQPRLGHELGTVVKRVYPAYQAKLAASNAVDFDDLLFHVAAVLGENPEVRAGLDERYRYILVDEYQDTNLAQYAIARALSIDHPNLAATGDPDQSIYGWRGANLNNILEFENDFPDVRVVRLERNYRSTKRILRVASELISPQSAAEREEPVHGERRRAEVRLITYPTQREEAEDIAAQIAGADRRRRPPRRRFRRLLSHQRPEPGAGIRPPRLGVPYQMVNGLEFLQRKEIKDILAYLQLLNNPHDETALLRVINTPPRGIGKTTIGRMAAYADAPRHDPAGRRPRRPQHRRDRRPQRRRGRIRRPFRPPCGRRRRAA